MSEQVKNLVATPTHVITTDGTDQESDVGYSSLQVLAQAMSNILLAFNGADILVDGSGTYTGDNIYDNIQDAIDDASAGDKIVILDSTYTEDVSHDKRLTIVAKGFGVVVVGDWESTDSADYSIVEGINFNDDTKTVTIGASYMHMTKCWHEGLIANIDSIVIDNGSSNNIDIILYEEE